MLPCQKELRKRKKIKEATLMARFFKTAPGEYGHGDLFLGGTKIPTLFQMAKKYQNLSFREIKILLDSEYHEERALGIKILVEQYQKTKLLFKKKRIVKFYLQNQHRINNWDLVDMSVHKIVGDYCLLTKDNSLILKLSDSPRHFSKRMSVVANWTLIKAGKFTVILNLCQKFLGEKEDLMHKACGWMLREVGKKDLEVLLKFIHQHGFKMPRTMLRYSIEKLDPKERQRILKETKLP